jgi:hypothetical protein
VRIAGLGQIDHRQENRARTTALRLTPDEWMARLVGHGYDEEKRAAIEALQWDLAQRALSLGMDVVLESGFWSRDERRRFRARAAELGAQSKLIYLDVPPAEMRKRLAERNASLPPESGFRVDLDQLDVWAGMFQPPTADELD